MFSIAAVLVILVVLVVVSTWFSTLSSAFKDASTADYILRPTSPEYFAWLRRDELDAQTRDLQSAGFVSVGDFTTEKTFVGAEGAMQHSAPIASPKGNSAPKAAPVQGFVRVFVHPQHGCTANILTAYQEQPHTAPIHKPCRIAVISEFGTGDEQTVVYATVNHSPDVFADLHRSGRSLWTRKIGANAAELLEIHLQRREELAPRFGLPLLRFRDADDYKAYEARSAARLRSIYARKNLFGATAQLALFKTTPLAKNEAEWLGDFQMA